MHGYTVVAKATELVGVANNSARAAGIGYMYTCTSRPVQLSVRFRGVEVFLVCVGLTLTESVRFFHT